jgi:hypothetical protein
MFNIEACKMTPRFIGRNVALTSSPLVPSARPLGLHAAEAAASAAEKKSATFQRIFVFSVAARPKIFWRRIAAPSAVDSDSGAETGTGGKTRENWGA